MAGKPKEADDKNDANEAERTAGDEVVEHPYYYDDAHGYQEFDPDTGDEDNEDDIGAGNRPTGS